MGSTSTNRRPYPCPSHILPSVRCVTGFAVRCGNTMKEIILTKPFPHGIDLTAPGGIVALLDFHRATFGDAVMEEAAGGQATELVAPPMPANPPVAPDESKLGDPGKAALQVERDARAAEKARADAAEARLQEIEDAKLSDIDRANKAAADAQANAARLEAENWRLAALATHHVPEGYRDLVTGTDAATYLASAKKISELYERAEGRPRRPEPIPGSGKAGDGGPAGSSVAAGREMYAAKHSKKEG